MKFLILYLAKSHRQAQDIQRSIGAKAEIIAIAEVGDVIGKKEGNEYTKKAIEQMQFSGNIPQKEGYS